MDRCIESCDEEKRVFKKLIHLELLFYFAKVGEPFELAATISLICMLMPTAVGTGENRVGAVTGSRVGIG